MNQTPNRPWYKHWWGIIFAILILPIFLIWFIWSRSHWHLVGKIAASAVIIIFVLTAYLELELLQILHTIRHNSRSLTIQSPAYTLAKYDLGHTPDAATVQQYQIALDSLIPYCMESQGKLAGEIWVSEQDLRKNGITHETNLNLLSYTRSGFQPNSPRSYCTGVLSAYLSLREPLIRL